MAQAGQGAGLASKSPGEGGVRGQVRGQELDGHGAVQVQLHAAVDDAHATAAKLGLHAELR